MWLAGCVDRMVTFRRNVPECSRFVRRYDWIHSALVLRPSCLCEKVAVNKKKGVYQRWYSHQKQEVIVIERNHLEGMRERKSRSGINSQGTLKQKDAQPASVKQGLRLLVHENIVSRLGLFMNCSEYYEAWRTEWTRSRACCFTVVRDLVCRCVENVENRWSRWTVFLGERLPAGVMETPEPWCSYTPFSLYVKVCVSAIGVSSSSWILAWLGNHNCTTASDPVCLKSVTWYVLAFVLLSAVSDGRTRLKLRNFAYYFCVRMWLYCVRESG